MQHSSGSPQRLSRKLNAVREAVARFEDARRARDAAIREAALTETMRDIAAAAGLSAGRVHQIVSEGITREQKAPSR